MPGQWLFRAEVSGEEGSGSLRLLLRRFAAERFTLAAADALGQARWEIRRDRRRGDLARFLRTHAFCRLDPRQPLRASQWVPNIPLANLPGLLTGEWPSASAVARRAGRRPSRPEQQVHRRAGRGRLGELDPLGGRRAGRLVQASRYRLAALGPSSLGPGSLAGERARRISACRSADQASAASALLPASSCRAPGRSLVPRMRFLSFAKVNLHLEVLRRREDGFHELRTIFQTIDLADEVELTLERPGRPASAVVGLEVEGARGLPADESNLAWRAAARFLARLGAARGGRAHPAEEAHPDRRRARRGQRQRGDRPARAVRPSCGRASRTGGARRDRLPSSVRTCPSSSTVGRRWGPGGESASSCCPTRRPRRSTSGSRCRRSPWPRGRSFRPIVSPRRRARAPPRRGGTEPAATRGGGSRSGECRGSCGLAALSWGGTISSRPAWRSIRRCATCIISSPNRGRWLFACPVVARRSSPCSRIEQPERQSGLVSAARRSGCPFRP